MHFKERKIRQVHVIETNTTGWFREGVPVYCAKTFMPLSGCIVMDDDDLSSGRFLTTIEVNAEVV